jgi:hypothetical protein
MAINLQFFLTDLYELTASKDSDLIIISDSKESFITAFHELAKPAGITNEGDIAFLRSVAESRLTPAAETTSSIELFIQGYGQI